jgi:8-oxo-dGTP diphosphatase
MPDLPDGQELPLVSPRPRQIVKTIVVCAAIIERDGRFLITRRQPGVPLEGLWEFPGGKCEAGETLAACLARELREELDADTSVGEEVFTTRHTYPEQSVELHFLTCNLIGEPVPQMGQQMLWAARDDLSRLQFPPADLELIRMLTSGWWRGHADSIPASECQQVGVHHEDTKNTKDSQESS